MAEIFGSFDENGRPNSSRQRSWLAGQFAGKGLEQTVAGKADSARVAAVEQAVTGKADSTRVTSLEQTVTTGRLSDTSVKTTIKTEVDAKVPGAVSAEVATRGLLSAQEASGQFVAKVGAALGTTNLDTLTEAGFYPQTVHNNASPDRNYPPMNTPRAGVLLVYRRGAGAVVQVYYPMVAADFRPYYRLTSDGTSWTAWRYAVLDNDARLTDSRTPKAHKHPVADITATGTPDSSKYLRGDGTWATPPVGDVTEEDVAPLVAPAVATEIQKRGLLTQADANTQYATLSGTGRLQINGRTLTPEETGTAVLMDEKMLQQEFVRSKGTVIGTAGKAAVALRFDHWLNDFGGKILPLMRARAIPSGLCVYSRMLTAGDPYWDNSSNNYTWADVQRWNMEDGVEIWSHSRSHQDTPGGATDKYAALVDEIVTSKAELEGFMPQVKIQGWMMPGITPQGGNTHGYLGFDIASMDVFRTTAAGRLLRQTYPIVETDAAGWPRELPTGPVHGQGHLTTDNLTLADLTRAVDRVIDRKWGLEFMTHAGTVDAAGKMTTADYTAFLDYLVAKRDAGLLDIVTPSGLYVADPARDDRARLVFGGDFKAPFDPVTNPGNWAGAVSSSTLVDEGGKRWVRIPDTQQWLTQTEPYIRWRGHVGETFEVTARVRRVNDAPVTARLTAMEGSTGPSWTRSFSLAVPSGTEGTVMRHVFTVGKQTVTFLLRAGRLSGGALDITDIDIRKV